MQVRITAKNILEQLVFILDQLTPVDYTKKCDTLNASIGQHIRHTLEFFICLEQGSNSGIINYDKRPHDKHLETGKELCSITIQRIIQFIDQQEDDKQLLLEVGYRMDRNDYVSINTNYLRELTYNIEHAVHHMALIKIGIKEVAPYVSLPDDFGIAVSTLRYQKELINH